MQTLAIDIETFSSADLLKGGVYKYVESPDFDILLFAYSFDGADVEIIDLTVDELPENLIEVLTDSRILKTAHNANFERTCLQKYLGIELSPDQWSCTMAVASMVGLPLSLDAVAKALNLEQQKDATGKSLIRYFCLPCKPTKVNGSRIRNHPQDDPEKWEKFKHYCMQDVRTEQAIRKRINWFTVPDSEIKLWQLDQRINDKGILLDPTLVNRAIAMDLEYNDKLVIEAIQLTGLDNPNSVSQLKKWMQEAIGEEVETLSKNSIPELLKKTDDKIVKRVLHIRQEMSRTSVKKYKAMEAAICADMRVRGLLQYYGANRTGRWAGRLVQVQNLPQNHLPDLELARSLVRDGDTELVDMAFGNVPDTLSQLIRTSFVAPPGHRFIIADFSAIEARVIAWLAGEQWRLQVFNTHGKIYEASASQMFKVPIQDIKKGSDLRQKGKVSELALGYQGGPNALITMGALKMGLKEEELPMLVRMWRNANKAIVAFWNTVQDAAITCVRDNTLEKIQHGISFFMERGVLFIELPSKRRLAYLRPKLVNSKFGGMALTYEGMSQTTKQWTRQDTYGGKLVENIVQAVARDCLADAMLRLDAAGYNEVMHVHDEIVMEEPYGKGSLEEVNKIMGTTIPWAKGLPLKADSYECEFYKKD